VTSLAKWIVVVVLAAFAAVAFVRLSRGRAAAPPSAPPAVAPAPAPAAEPERTAPERFPANTYLPRLREVEACGGIDMGTFSPGGELVRVDDARVVWESDLDDACEEEDDHSMHRSVAVPLRRLIGKMAARGLILEVHDAYRPTGVHNQRSLHREGRAIDLTCDQIQTEELARMAWESGFDWVYHEGSTRNNGPHVHASMRRDPTRPGPGPSTNALPVNGRSPGVVD